MNARHLTYLSRSTGKMKIVALLGLTLYRCGHFKHLFSNLSHISFIMQNLLYVLILIEHQSPYLISKQVPRQF